ncbi:MAG: glycosyltransferase, partial [Candidatus Diapherotrites archaeon]|nr:glycosyltransferase [Candidatus Diapherotrites archaeon]
MRKKLVSVIVLNMNGIALTRQCLESVKKNTAYKPVEVIAVDNGSDEENVTGLRELKGKGLIDKLILNKTNLGYSAGVNQGFEAARGKFLFHLDNDTLVEKGWLEKSLEAARNYQKKVGVVGSALVAEADYGKGLRG